MKRLIKIVNRKNIPSSKKLVIFSIFLFISSLLWFFNTLSNSYDDYIEVEYTYSNYPEGKGILGDLPSYSRIELATSGFNLFRYKYFLSTPVININIDKCSEHNQNSLQFIDKYIKSSIVKVLGKEVNVLQTYFSNRKYKLSTLVSKKVIVKSNISINFDTQYRLISDIVILPKRIKVSGYKGVIDTLSVVYTEPVSYNKLNKNVSENVKLKQISNLRYSSDSVLVSVLVEKFTEKRLKIPIKIINKPAGVNVKLFETELNVKFNIGFDEYDRVDASVFKAIVDYKQIMSSKSNVVEVRVVKYPINIGQLSFSPKRIEFLLEKK